MVSFNLFGIKITVSVGFLSVITFMLYLDKTGLMVWCLCAVTAHELGHIVTLKLLKASPEIIVIKVGTIGVNGNYNLRLSGEALMLLMGPVINFLLSFLFYACYLLCENTEILNLSLVMLIFGIYNLLPINGLDGGSLLQIALSEIITEENVSAVTKAISIIFSLILFVLGTFIWLKFKNNPSLLLLSVYLLVCSLKST